MNKPDGFKQVVVLTVALWDTCLNGRGIGEKYYAYMKADPKPGDLVLEMSTAYFRLKANRWDSGGLGHFLRTGLEPMYDDQVKFEIECPGEPMPQEMVWYIRSAETGKELRWTNCLFIRVPTELVLLSL